LRHLSRRLNGGLPARSIKRAEVRLGVEFGVIGGNGGKPQANAMSPDFVGVNAIATGSFSGSARLMFSDGNTTSVAQVLSVERTNVMRAGVPVRNVSFAGSNPCAVTTTFLAWVASLLGPLLDAAGAMLASAAVLDAGLRPRRSRSALTKKLPSVTTTSPG